MADPTTTAEEVVLNFDAWLNKQPPEIRGGIDQHLKASGAEAENQKRYLGSVYAVASEAGMDVHAAAKNWNTVRRGYAEQQGGEWDKARDDEAVFHQQLVKRVTKRKDVRIQSESFSDAGAMAALKLNPGDRMKELAKVEADAAGIQGMDPEDHKRFKESYFRARDAVENAVGPYRQDARIIAGMLGVSAGVDAPDMKEKALDRLMELPPEGREHVVRLIASDAIGDFSDSDEKQVKSAARGFATQMRGFGSTAERTRILRLQEQLNAGDVRLLGGETPERAYARLASTAPKEGTAVTGALPAATIFYGRPPTPAERDTLKALAAKGLERNVVAGQVANLIDESIDPIRARNYTEKIILNTASSLGMMAPIMVPYAGVVIAQGGYADQEFQRQISLGTDPGTAHKMAEVTGAVQAAVERVSFLFSFAPGSWAGKLAPKFTSPGLAGKLIPQVLGRMGTIQAAEYTEEIVQDATPSLTALVAESAGWSLPETAKFEAESKRWKLWNPETFLTVAALSLAGGGAQGVANTMQARAALDQQLSDPLAMQALGIPQTEAERIAALPENERMPAFRAEYSNRNPETPEAGTAREQIAARDAQARERGQQEVERLGSEGITISRNGEDYLVTDAATGESVPHATAAAAMETARKVSGERDRADNEMTFRMLEELDANPLSPVRDMEVTIRDGKTVPEYLAERAAIMQDETATPEARQKAEKEAAAMQRRQEVKQAETPDTPLDWNKMAVGGQSELQVRDGVARAVIHVANGQSPYTAFEEKVETEPREWVRSGVVTWGRFAEMLRQAEQATGDKYLFGYTDGQDAKQDVVAIIEAYSELAQVHATAKSRAGKAPASGIARVARQDRKDARGAWQRIKEAISAGTLAPELVARLKAHVEWLKAVVTKARNLSRARREGGALDIDAFLDKSVGIGADARHAEAVVQEAERIYTPPTQEQEDDGIAFNLTSRAAPVEKNAPVREYGNATVVGPATFRIEAYHGTPHRVREFSTDRIGTGEGQQVFGWGLYFAALRRTAEWYRDTLAAEGEGNIYTVELDLEDSQLLDWDSGRHSEQVKAALAAAYKAAGFNASPDLHSGSDVMREMAEKLGSPRAASEHLLAHGIRGVRYLDGASRSTKAARDFMLKFDEVDLDRRADAETVMEAVESGEFSEEDAAFLRALEADDWLGFDYPAIAVNTALSESIEDFDVSPELAAMARERMGPVNYNYVVFDEADIKITAENGKPVEQPEMAGASFKLTPVSTLDRLAAQMARRTRDPEQRRTVYNQMTRALDTLRRQWTEMRTTWMGDDVRPLSEKRTKSSLNKEQAYREAAAYAEAEQRVFESLTPSAQSALGMTVDDTSAYKGPLAQMFSGGRFGTKGRIRSRAEVMREAGLWDQSSMGGEYDGAAGLPPLFFGGSLRADQAAQEAYDAGYIDDASPDTLWTAIGKELNSQAKNKKALKNAMTVLKEAQQKAKADAKAEGQAWRTEADAIQAKDWDSQAVMLRHLRTLDAILSALPPEIRGKVGGWTSIASLKSPDAMAKELEHRLKVADEHLEQHLATQALEDLEALLLRAQPDREAGKRSKGKLGAEVHRFFDEVTRVFNLSPDQVEQETVLLEKGMAGKMDDQGNLIPPDDDSAADIFEKQFILEQYGALGRLTSRNKIKSHDAAHAVAALDKLEQVYTEGRNRWRIMEEIRLADVKEKADQVTATLGGPSYAGSQKQKSDAGKVSSRLTKWAWDLKSFRQTMEDLLGPDHPLALRFSRMAREGFAQRNDDVSGSRARFKTASEVATGKKGRHAIRAIWEMGDATKGQKITVRTAGKAVNKTESIPIAVIAQWKDGTADPAALGLTKGEAAEMVAAMDAMSPEDNRMLLELMRGGREGVETVKMTEADGVFLTMLGRQDQYSGALDRAGWDAAALESIENQLSPAAKYLREHLAGEYRDGYAPLAKVFERMFGVALPQIKNYAPAAFYSMGTDAVADPTGSGVVEGGFRAGFLKNRKNHAAAPKIENAFATYFGHVNQTAHWKALAETVREMKGVFGRPDVKQAIESAHGRPVLGALQQWITALEGNGIQQSGGELDAAVRWLANAQTYIGLAWNLGTIMKQSSAMLGSAFKMPGGAYVVGLGRFLSGNLTLSRADVFASPVIQRRLINGFSPEVRAAMNQMWGAAPSLRMTVLDAGMEVIGYTDAYFTSISAAIAYDYHFRQAREAGMSEMEAEREAMQLTTDIVGETAQPADVADKSLMELRMNAFGKLLFMFGSEARQKSSLLISAWGKTLTGKATKQDLQVLAISHLVLPAMMAVIGAAWRDARDDDDDSFFEMDHWNPLDFLRASATMPLSGIPLIRNLVSEFNDTGILGRFGMGVKSFVDLFKGPEGAQKNEPAEFYVGKISKVMQALDAFTGVAGKIGEQAFDFVDNLIDTDSEEKAKKAKAQRKADDENRPERLTPEQKEARRQQGIERDAARFDANNPPKK